MRQTAGHRSYVESRAVLSRHGQSAAYSSSRGRRGFTLIEVVVAFAILLILMIGLMQFYARNLVASRNIYITETAQTLVELQVEDLRSMSVAKLAELVKGSTTDLDWDINYPTNKVSAGAGRGNRYLSTEVSGQTDGYYDSNFLLPNVETIVLTSPVAVTVSAGSPDLPASLVLPNSVTIARHSNGTDWTYFIRVMRSSFPNMFKRVELELVSDGTFTKGSETVIGTNYEWKPTVPDKCVFKYTVSVKWTLAGRDHVFKVSGLLGRSITG